MSTETQTDIAHLRGLLAVVECCAGGPDFGIENWGGEGQRTHRMTEHCQVSLARCSEGHEGFLHPATARLVYHGINALPGLLNELEALRGEKP